MSGLLFVEIDYTNTEAERNPDRFYTFVESFLLYPLSTHPYCKPFDAVNLYMVPCSGPNKLS